MRALLVLFVSSVACRGAAREPVDAAAPASSASTSAVASSPPPPSSSAPSLAVQPDDRCNAHAECEAIRIFPAGDLRCCLSCAATAAVSNARAVLEACALERKMRDCPTPDCPAIKPAHAACVAHRCVLVD